MTDKTKLFEHVGDFIDSVVKGDAEKDQESYGAYLREKVKQIREKANLSEKEHGGIQFKGDDVYVGNKKVGTATSDAADMDSGINFTSVDGSFSKEFNELQDLYNYLIDKYNVQEGRVEDAVFKQEKGREARKRRWNEVRKRKHKDGTPGDYEEKDLSKYHDAIKGKSGDAAHQHSTDKRHKDGYYDSHDARPKHSDAIKGKATDGQHQHTLDKRHKDGYYDSHDPRPAQRSRK